MAGQLQSRRRGLVALSTVAGLLVVGWLAGLPWLAGHWPRVLAVGLFLVMFVAPRLFVPARSAASLAQVTDPAARSRLETSGSSSSTTSASACSRRWPGWR